ncbi:AAA domain-containing protein [Actinomadura sp. NEAU-AAG5]|uniref:AAA domain-containing protein n=1 Tax=Actinomadura litoris TaxID=2678616 RepID=A0A7K1KST5_9ACTN|nr:AAA domain-containing protein [Actinomadura litoris]
MLFVDGVLSPADLADQRVADVLYAATDRAGARVRTGDLLHAAIDAADQGLRSMLARALQDGAYLRDLQESIQAYNPGSAGGGGFGGHREDFSAEALAALDAFVDRLASFPPAGDHAKRLGLELFVACVLAHLDADDRLYLTFLDAERAAAALFEQVRVAVEPLPPLLDEASGRVRSEEFTEAAWAALEQSGEQAADLGYDRVLPPHLLLALLAETEGPAEHLMRLQVPPQLGLAKVASSLADAFRIAQRKRGAPPLAPTRESFGPPLLDLLGRAQRSAAVWDSERIDTPHLLDALLADPPARLVSVFQAPPLKLSLDQLRAHLDEELREAGGAASRENAFRLPAGAAPSQDLTWLARTEGITPALHLDGYVELLSKALHRVTAPHVVITGLPGVGTTTLLRELARRAAEGEIPFLARKRFVHVDCGDLAPADSGEALTQIIDHIAGRTDVIVCADGLGSLIRGKAGTDHRLTLRSALKQGRLHLVGVMSAHEFDDLIGSDRTLRELVSRVDMDEPGQAEAQDMAASAARGLAAEFGVEVDGRAVADAVALSADFILNERQPSKAIRVLRRACDDLHYRRTQAGSADARVDTADIVAVVAEISGVPAEQISGTGGARIDFERSLGEVVVGQEEAVRVVASELRRIKLGLTGVGGRPASVMLFAGLTGVGKTELAKAVARFYSASKRLHTYPMENYAEPHSISGIIGAPPGYHGHDQGGRLINDLNSDPYCVFLLDEGEKAHPEVWRPFLNLFDEGWIIDQRGVKAFGDRAIFIITSNAGHETIARLSAQGRSQEEITEAVRRDLLNVRDRTRQAVFAPEFLGRLRQIVVFRPLDRAAMTGIARKLFDEQRAYWGRRGKELVVPDALVEHVADRSHEANERSGGTEGGRIVAKTISRLVEDEITRTIERRQAEFEKGARIELAFRPGAVPPVGVAFGGAPA